MARRRVAAKWIRGPVDRLAIEQGCYFDEEAARFPCDFIERFCRQSKGRWKGVPIELLDWQRDFLMRLFGWKLPDGLRRFRRAYLEVAKKNGKSTLVSALVLFFLLGDGEGAPEIYLNACDKDQASIVFEEAKRMVDDSPDFTRRLSIVNSKADKRILDPDGNGSIIVNSSVAASKDGLNPSATIFDELHRQPDRALWSVFEFAGAAREQPLLLSITTAGEAPEGVWYEQREYSEKVNKGLIPDIQHLGVVYRADDKDDPENPKTWAKANPSLGKTLKADEFRAALVSSKEDPERWANFLRLRLNIICREEKRFLDLADWDACEQPPQCRRTDNWFGGLDLSSIDDLAAFAAISGDVDEGFDVIFKFWLPEDEIVALERKHKVPYRLWADAGLITLTPGEVIDYAFIRAEVNEFASDYNLVKLFIDPYNANQFSIQVREQDGLPAELFRQGYITMNAPTKELRRLVTSKRLRHDGHAIARWMASNAVTTMDESMNIKINKKKSRQKVDGLAALVNAIGAATSGDGDGGESIYESRGLTFLN
jgi:phage terminase large subunit-like protein